MQLPTLTEYSGYQFRAFRIVFGIYLFFHFAMLVPYANELFSEIGVLDNPSLNLTYPAFLNILNILPGEWSAPTFVTILALLSLVFAIGGGNDKFRPLVSLLLWYGWACLFNRNNLIANPGLPYVGWLLLACAVIPRGEGEKKDWRMPSEVFFGAWVLLALGYTISGIAKLTSPSWADGTAFLHLLNNPLARDTALRSWMASLPMAVIKLHTWGALFFEIAFLPLCFFAFTRKIAWLSMMAMHLGILCFVDFADLTFGMLMIHLFTFDPRWLPLRPALKEKPVIFFDGVCGLCNHFVDFVFAVDHANVFNVSALQGELAKSQGISTGESKKEFKSVVLEDEAGIHRGSTAVIRILSRLGGMWGVISLLRIIPTPVRDVVYNFVAINRYRWFGKKETCRLPTPEERSKFLP